MAHLATYVALLHRAEQTLADSLRTVGQGHSNHPDVLFTCQALAAMSEKHVRQLEAVAQRYGEQARAQDLQEPERLHAAGLADTRSGPVGLLRDLQDLHLLATLVQTSWTVVAQAAQGLRDTELQHLATHATTETSRQISWFTTHMKVAAPQALIVSA